MKKEYNLHDILDKLLNNLYESEDEIKEALVDSGVENECYSILEEIRLLTDIIDELQKELIPGSEEGDK